MAKEAKSEVPNTGVMKYKTQKVIMREYYRTLAFDSRYRVYAEKNRNSFSNGEQFSKERSCCLVRENFAV